MKEKGFMVQQIESSIKFDCTFTEYDTMEPVLLTGAELISKSRKALQGYDEYLE